MRIFFCGNRCRIRRPFRRPRLSLFGLMVAFALLFALFSGTNAGSRQANSYPDLSLNAAAVTCANAQATFDAFEPIVNDAVTKDKYDPAQRFGFSPPRYPAEVAPFKSLLKSRLTQVDEKARSVTDGTCTDAPTATVTDVDGKTLTLPIIYGKQPATPITGNESNKDSRTVPVTIGTTGDKNRTNTWSELDELYGDQKWYTNCANSNLIMNWDTDVPKLVSTETEHDNRFILAVNTTLDDAAIRQKAASDGNPRVDDLQIVRVDSIINTMYLNKNRCVPFIDMRSMVRVSLGRVIFDENGQWKGLVTEDGVFVDCHNLWRLLRSKPVPTKVPPKSTTSTTPPGKTTPSTPPTTTTPTCTNGGTPPKCLEVKGGGPVSKDNIPTSVRGTQAPGGSTTEPRPPDPPDNYDPQPITQTTQPTTSRTTPSNESTGGPGTGTNCPPGVTVC
jgi:hypothetical protein